MVNMTRVRREANINGNITWKLDDDQERHSYGAMVTVYE